MLLVSDLADRGHALDEDHPHLAAGQTEGGVLALFGHDLGRHSGRADHGAAPAGLHLDIVDEGADGDVPKLGGVAGLDVHARSGLDHLADGKAVGSQDVPLLPVEIVDEGDPRRAVGIVLDGGDAAGNAQLVALEVDDAVVALVAAAAVPHGDAARVVAPGLLADGLEQAALRLGAGDLLVGGDRHVPTSGSDRLENFDTHGWILPSP